MASAYEMLGVPADCCDAEIRRRYRELARETHPDLGGDPFVFDELNHAYELISTPERRAVYDDSIAVNHQVSNCPSTEDVHPSPVEDRHSKLGWLLLLIGIPIEVLQYAVAPFVVLWSLTGSATWAALLTVPVSFTISRCARMVLRGYRKLG